MIDVGLLVDTLKRDLGTEFGIVRENEECFRIHTPFIFDDGDHINIVIKRDGERWVLSDEGHTYFHLTLDVRERDLLQGPRREIINSTLSLFDVNDRGGELVLPIIEDHVPRHIFEFAQVILRIADVSYLSRERVESTFQADLARFIRDELAPKTYQHKWHDPRDNKRIYEVDYRVNSRPKPIFLFALSTSGRTKDATIALHQLSEWQVEYEPVGIFENRSKIVNKDVERLSDVCRMQYEDFSQLNRAHLARFLHGQQANEALDLK